jgi:myo-inositol-1(or 4)-monophosphatase
VNATYDPIRDEMFTATLGGGAYLNGRRIHVSTIDNLAGALVQLSFPRDRAQWEHSLVVVRKITEVAPHARNVGSSALAQAWVAAGRMHAHARVSIGEFDIVGGNLLILEAGGTVTDLAGRPFSGLGTGLLAAAPAIHPQLVALDRTTAPDSKP